MSNYALERYVKSSSERDRPDDNVRVCDHGFGRFDELH